MTYGHDTDVVEPFARDFQGNWTGSAAIVGAGDDERLHFIDGQDKESESRYVGTGQTQITINSYKAGKGTPTIEYRTADNKAACDVAGWVAYVGAFNSLGWVGVRLES